VVDERSRSPTLKYGLDPLGVSTEIKTFEVKERKAVASFAVAVVAAVVGVLHHLRKKTETALPGR